MMVLVHCFDLSNHNTLFYPLHHDKVCRLNYLLNCTLKEIKVNYCISYFYWITSLSI